MAGTVLVAVRVAVTVSVAIRRHSLWGGKECSGIRSCFAAVVEATGLISVLFETTMIYKTTPVKC